MAYQSNRKNVDRQYRQAIERGINKTTGQGAEATRDITPVLTGRALESVTDIPAEWQNEWVCIGAFGSIGVEYWIYIEKGTRYIVGRHMLTRAEAQVVPGLQANIKAEMP